jgi:hypothetical protein
LKILQTVLNKKRRLIRESEFRESARGHNIDLPGSKKKRKRKSRGNGGKDTSNRKERIDLNQGKRKGPGPVDKGKGVAITLDAAKCETQDKSKKVAIAPDAGICETRDKGKGVAFESFDGDISTQSQDLLMDIVMPDDEGDEGQAGPSRVTGDLPQGNKRKADDSIEDVPAKRTKVSSPQQTDITSDVVPEPVEKSLSHEQKIFDSFCEWPIEDLEMRFIECRAVLELIREWSGLNSRLDVLSGQRGVIKSSEAPSYRGFLSRYA